MACTAAAAALHFKDTIASMDAIIVVVFFFLTAPVASHLTRASYTSGHRLWSQTIRDDYAESRTSGPDDRPTPKTSASDEIRFRR